MTDQIPTGTRAPSHHTTRRVSGTWLVAALIASAVCLGLLAGEFVGLVNSPIGTRGIVAPPPLETDDALTVAVARTPGGPGEWSNWAVVIKYLSDEIGQPVTVRYLSKEDEVADIVAAEDVDIAFVCAHHYVDLAETGTCVGVCTPIIGGTSVTRQMLVVRADDSAESLEDVRGSVVTVSDKSSLGGLAYFSYLTDALGMVPEEFCGELRLGDTQEQNMHDVLVGTARATVVSSVQVAGWDMAKFKVIEQSEPIGAPPVVVNAGLDPALRKRVEQVLLAFDAQEMLAADSEIDGFKVLDPAEYEFAFELRDACGHHTD